MNDDIARIFETFREQCIWLRCCYNTFQALYDSDNQTDELLKKAASLLISGGKICYSTCSLQPSENNLLVKNSSKPIEILLSKKSS